MKLRTCRPSLVFAGVLLVVSGRAAAEGADLRLYRPPVDEKGFLSVNGSEVLGAGDVSLGLTLDVGVGLLPFEGFVNDDNRAASEAERRAHVVDQLFTGTLHGNVGVGNWLVVGAKLPVHAVIGPDMTVPGVINDAAPPSPTRALSAQSVGDVSLHGKARITRVDRHGLGLAAILSLSLPTGSSGRFAGAPGVGLWPVLAAEARPHRLFRVGLNLGARLQTGSTTTLSIGGRTEPSGMAALAPVPAFPSGGAPLRPEHLFTFGLGASVRAAPALEVLAEVNGSQVMDAVGDPGSLSLEAMAGIKVFVQAQSYLVIGGGLGLPPRDGFQRADARALLGFVFEPSIGDRDGDGLKNDLDECPDEPEDHDHYADADGCPDADNDRDGILDVDDACPLVPEDRDGDADADGCPEGNEGDRDGDGILDDEDGCPDDPEDRDGFEDGDGCPDRDNDRDGILDVDDLCPDDPEDRDGFEDGDGCPDRDNDGDRILDVDDLCPDDPERYNGIEDEDGCPDSGPIAFEGDTLVLFDDIHFKTDSAVIESRSDPLLDSIAAGLRGNPQVRLVEIQGHADERGTDEYNLALTRDRAAAVREALLLRGIAGDRMRSQGYGERCPLDPRSTLAAYEKNRRVEIKIVVTDEGPTHVELACPRARDLLAP